MRVVNVELVSGSEVVRMNREPRDASFRKTGREVVTAARIGDRDGNGRRRPGPHDGRTAEIHAEDVAKPVPSETSLLREAPFPVRVRPDGSRIRALVIGRRKTENR